jgi:uncharacterized protein (DUF736 family)
MNDEQKPRRDDELGALWRKQTDDGRPDYFTGSVQVGPVKIDIVVFENQYRKADNHPEYRILRSRPKTERTSTRRDEQPEQRRDPRPPSRHETLGVRPEDQPSFNPRSAFGKPKPVNGAKNADWTDDVPHPVSDEDLGF